MTEIMSDRLREAIEQDIAAGVFAPGAKLDEASLAARYQASRTPVREALRHLAAGGLVEIRPRRGAVVAIAGPDRLFQMFEVMAELEAICGRLAARRVTPQSRLALIAAQARCRDAMPDPDRYYTANEAFHQAVYRAGGNPVLEDQCLALQKQLRPYRRLQLRVGNRVQKSFEEHEEIVAAIAAGEDERASAALRAHVVVQGERFSDLVASLAKLNAA